MRVRKVLILVLVEYSLWEDVILVHLRATMVLILVLVEYSLWDDGKVIAHEYDVLILVLVEYSLWDL